MFAKIFNKLLNRPQLSPQEKEYIKYLKAADPNSYKIRKRRLVPKKELVKHYRRIRELFPDPLTSFLDIGSSKGFFVFTASGFSECKRSLGIDVYQYDIDVCHWLKKYLQNDIAQFELLQLHELAERIDEFGGPFQTVLISNSYPDLYFGGTRFSNPYLNHDEIFMHLRKICSERIIFNNQITIENTEQINQINHQAHDNYNEEKLLEAASKHFHIIRHGSLGQYPLWTMDVKENVATAVSIPELKEVFDLWTNDFSFRQAFKKNPEAALIQAGFDFESDKLQKIKSMLKQHAIQNEDLDKRISR